MRLVRPLNLLFLGTLLFLWRFCLLDPLLDKVALSPTLSLLEFTLLVLAILFIAAGGYAINDYHNYASDVINRKPRIVVGRELSMKEALLVFLVSSGMGVLLGGWVALRINLWKAGLLFPATAFLLWLYSTSFQRYPLVGNLIVAFVVTEALFLPLLFEPQVYREMIDLFGYLGLSRAIMTMTAFYAVSAGVLTLIREIVKDIADMPGDEEAGYRTLPIVIGLTNTRWILALLTLGFLWKFLDFTWFLFQEGFQTFSIYLWGVVVLPSMGFVLVLPRLRAREDFQKWTTGWKIIMALASLSYLLLYLTIRGILR